MQMTADVKCYYCGHISGQVKGTRHEPLRASSFIPREGYTGSLPRPGTRLRCERCGGPVFLEDVSPLTLAPMAKKMAAAKRAAGRDAKAA